MTISMVGRRDQYRVTSRGRGQSASVTSDTPKASVTSASQGLKTNLVQVNVASERREWSLASLEGLERWEAKHGLGQGDAI